jgi:predicted nucleic acid-binding protein
VRVAADSSVVVAALAVWHEHHEIAAGVLAEPLKTDDLVLPVHVLIESYAVLTRLPAPFRVAAGEARAALEASFGSTSLSGFPTRATWSFLRALVERDVAGGAAYDGAIVRAAIHGGAKAIFTFNPRHFLRFASEIEIVDPSR